MAKYEWDLKELRKKRSEILSLLDLENDSNDLLNLHYSKTTYDYLFDTFCMVEYYDDLDDLDWEDNKELIRDFAEIDYCSMDKSVLSIVDKSLEPFAECNRKFSEILLSFIKLNNDQLVEVVSALFKNLPSKDFRKRFEYISDPKKNLIHIQYLKNETQSGDLGFCYIDTLNHIPYGSLLRMNTIADLITLGHEIMHMIIRKESPPIKGDNPRQIYNEVEGFFSNFMFSPGSNGI